MLAIADSNLHILAINDIRAKYSNTSLGWLWIPLSFYIQIMSIAMIYSQISGQEMASYISFMAWGIVTWNFVYLSLIDGANAVETFRFTLLNSPQTLSDVIARVFVKNAVIFLVQVCAMIALTIFFFELTLNPRVVILFLAAIFSCCYAIIMFSCLSGAFIRDSGQIFSSAMGVLFLVSPIIWYPENVTKFRFVVDYNPIYYLSEFSRFAFTNRAIEFDHNFVLLICIGASSALFLLVTKIGKHVTKYI